MPMINCKVELKLKWMNHCVWSLIGNDNDDGFTIKDTELYVPAVTLSAKDNQNLNDQCIGIIIKK